MSQLDVIIRRCHLEIKKNIVTGDEFPRTKKMIKELMFEIIGGDTENKLEGLEVFSKIENDTKDKIRKKVEEL